MKITDWSRIPLPKNMKPGFDGMQALSTFWFLVPTLPEMTYDDLSHELLSYLYNEGYKIVRLDDKDLQ